MLGQDTETPTLAARPGCSHRAILQGLQFISKINNRLEEQKVGGDRGRPMGCRRGRGALQKLRLLFRAGDRAGLAGE